MRALSAHLRARGKGRIEHQKVKLLPFLGMHRGDQHAAGLDAHHRPRRQIGDHKQRLANQLLRLKEGRLKVFIEFLSNDPPSISTLDNIIPFRAADRA